MSRLPDVPPPRDSRRLAESPLLWICLFAGMALVALFVVAPKYSQRQGRLVVQQETRQQLRTPTESAEGETAETEPLAPVRPDSENRGIMNLWPLAAALIVAMVMAAAIYALTHHRRRKNGS